MAPKKDGPGPGAYMLPSTIGYAKTDYRKTRSPRYSFGLRSQSSYEEDGPGPAAYKLGSVTRYGKATNLKFSMLHRGELE
ncbi:uncharacterized protein Dwil_GK27063 [Drosophila willistoni]|uniref:Outer dense fiber protein 3 n=1 Tax=Drosophila willistoni TaxID=7260 RepID=A0A0Q9WV57_DROWI|nr:outer dense fiber protein 3-like protein 2 [Drosophila willistoni]KRG00015.1 uncharacterized protein Dwil_GK27063 [Drosophila willistoni]